MKIRARVWVCLLGSWTVAAWAAAPESAPAPVPAASEVSSTTAPSPALEPMARALLEQESLSQRRALEQFAQRSSGDLNGVLAHLVLGYHAYQGKKYAEATEHFRAVAAISSPLQDYGVYYLALSGLGAGSQAAVAPVLEGFAEKYPLSPMAPQAAVKRAESLLALGQPAEAITVLNAAAPPLPQPDAKLLLAQAYRDHQEPLKAAETYQEVYYLYAASPLASQAEKELPRLKTVLGSSFPAPSIGMRQLRADRLFEAGDWQSAQKEYRILAADGPIASRDRWRVRVGVCQYQAGATWTALTTLKALAVSDPDAGAERLYTIAALYRRLDRPQDLEQQIQSLAENYPESAWYEKALFLAGNYYLLQKDPERSGTYFRMVYQKFPQTDAAALSHWRVTWESYRSRRLPEAKRLFEEQIQTFPSSAQVPAALYWLARLMEPESKAISAAYYQKILEVFPNYYYGLLARQRLEALPPDAQEASAAMTLPLDGIQRPAAGESHGGADSPEMVEHQTRARLLESAWLMDLAMDELKAALAKDPSAAFLGLELARLERKRDRFHVSLQYAKRFVKGYLSLEAADLPRDHWEMLFPLPWWEQIRKQAQAARLDPYLVAGLIRQESEFNPEARSRSNARGLMQLLPSTARQVAKRVPERRARQFQLGALYTPDINLVYGTRYLSQVLERFQGSTEQALAAYNAGGGRVLEWLQAAPFGEPAEFVESIPFTETREYVQAVLRNAAVYRTLYAESKSH